jgi:antitoxin component HigA of HigAB toxin-antitoxin module
MDIRAIKTEADYRKALEEVERLFDAVPDTPEGDRLEMLSTLVEASKKSTMRSRCRIPSTPSSIIGVPEVSAL